MALSSAGQRRRDPELRGHMLAYVTGVLTSLDFPVRRSRPLISHKDSICPSLPNHPHHPTLRASTAIGGSACPRPIRNPIRANSWKRPAVIRSVSPELANPNRISRRKRPVKRRDAREAADLPPTEPRNEASFPEQPQGADKTDRFSVFLRIVDTHTAPKVNNSAAD